MPTLNINGVEQELEENEEIQSYCEDGGIPFACTEGICGTCVIEIEEGSENLSDPTEEEYDFLGDDVAGGEGSGKERLACQCKIKCGTVKIKY